MTAASWARRRLWDPVKVQLRQGLSPQGLVWSACLALGCSLCPVIGATTLLCLLVGTGLRLNHPVMQVVNYLAYPLQIALLVPFWRLGERLFGAPRMDLDLAHVLSFLHADVRGAVRFYGAEVWHGVVAWGIVAVPLACLASLALEPVARRLAPRWRENA